MWKMKSPEMSCLFCVMLLIQNVHAETPDVSTCDQANHRLLIIIIALDSILLIIITPLGCCFFLDKCSKDPKREDNDEKEELLRRRIDRVEDLRATIETLEKKIESLKRIIDTVEELRATIEILEKKIETLEKKIETLEKENETLKEEKETLKEENETLKMENETLKKENELMCVQRYKVNVTLDADTAHPRLEVSEDGKSVTDTGVIRKVPSKEERFDSHTFLLAKEGYMFGRHYWEVDVGKKRNWNLGVAQETVARKEAVALSPKNGFWVIGLADGQEYWAYSDPWTRLTVSGRPEKIGIFLDISSKKLSFISVHQNKVLYTFTSVSPHGQNVRLFPFFSTGSSATSSDTEPLRIA